MEKFIYNIYLRYMNRIFWTQEFATFPETIKGCHNGARYNTVKDLQIKNEKHINHFLSLPLSFK